LDIDKEGWSLSDWKTFALAVRDAHQHALDGWGTTVAELEAHSKLVAELRESNAMLRNHIDLLHNALTMIPTQPTIKRGRGRPKKHGEFNLAEWYERECLPKFKERNQGRSPGVQKVLTWHFQQLFRELGLNPLKVTSKEYQQKLKTMRNVISDQKPQKWGRKLPEK
jgi:hypothetical protein